MKLPIYIAGGYPDKATAKAVAELLDPERVYITYRWWDVDQRDPSDVEWLNAIARLEIKSIRQARIMVVLDKFAGTGTASELGYFSAMRATFEVPRYTLRVVHAEGPRKLDWFARAFDVADASVNSWEPPVIVQAIEGILSMGAGPIYGSGR